MMLLEAIQQHPNAGVNVRHPAGAIGRKQPDYGIDIDLRKSKDKDCDWQPNQYALSPEYERGKA